MLKYKNIVKEPNDILTQKCAEVTFPLEKEDINNLEMMMEYIIKSQDEEQSSDFRPGVGLAAPQIGISKRYFVMHFEENGIEYHEYVINPKIVASSEQLAYVSSGEGCLSVEDDYPGITLRNNRIMLEYYDINGHKKETTFTGFAAIVVQHENDHLDGILFHTKIASPLQASLVEKAIKI
jgi:peptide deformylase